MTARKRARSYCRRTDRTVGGGRTAGGQIARSLTSIPVRTVCVRYTPQKKATRPTEHSTAALRALERRIPHLGMRISGRSSKTQGRTAPARAQHSASSAQISSSRSLAPGFSDYNTPTQGLDFLFTSDPLCSRSPELQARRQSMQKS